MVIEKDESGWLNLNVSLEMLSSLEIGLENLRVRGEILRDGIHARRREVFYLESQSRVILSFPINVSHLIGERQVECPSYGI